MTAPTTPTVSSTYLNFPAEVRQNIIDLLDGAPAALDTLNELAAALSDDANFATTVTDLIALKANKSGDTFTGQVDHTNNLIMIGSGAALGFKDTSGGALLGYFGTSGATTGRMALVDYVNSIEYLRMDTNNGGALSFYPALNPSYSPPTGWVGVGGANSFVRFYDVWATATISAVSGIQLNKSDGTLVGGISPSATTLYPDWYSNDTNWAFGVPGKGILCGGTVQATAFNATSRREFKKEIKKWYGDALGLLNTIDVMEFKWKKGPDTSTRIGFIADDTDNIFSKDGTVFDMYNTMGVMIKGIQKLSQRMEALESKIDALQVS